jgi:hypothetical protein
MLSSNVPHSLVETLNEIANQCEETESTLLHAA